MGLKHLLIGAGGPVVPGVGHPPFLCGHSTEDQGLFRLVATVHQALGNAHHQGDGGAIILEAVEVSVVVGADHHHGIWVFSGDHPHDVIAGAIQPHLAFGVKGHGDLPVF